jgi:hypothetical protein
VIAEHAQDAAQLAAVFARQIGEHSVDLLVVHRQDRLDEGAPAIGEPYARRASVVGVGPALDDAVALGPIDQPGHVPGRDEKRAREAGKRLTVVTVQAREEIEARHRHAPTRG